MRNYGQRKCLWCGQFGHGYGVICPSVDAEMREALVEYAKSHGRTWKAQLSLDWTEGVDLGAALQRVRNVVGPSRLYAMRLPIQSK